MDIIQISWRDIPHKDKEWYEAEAQRMTEEEIARELDISYEKSSRTVVFKEFKEAHIIRGEFKPDPNLKVIRTHDYGKTCASLYSQKDAFNNLTFFHEIVLINEENPTDKLARANVSYSADLSCQGFADHDDPAGKTDNYVNPKETSFMVMQKYGITPTHSVSLASNRRRENRVEKSKYFLGQFPDGQPQIRIHESCTYLINALQGGYRYKEDPNTKEPTDIILEEHPHEDLADVFGITIVEQLTIQTPRKAVRRPKRSVNPYTGY